MPSSRWNHIPTIINVVHQLQPQSILDIGVGFGKWGVLFREYVEIVKSERDPDRYYRPNWRVRIDGIEGFANYITDVHRYVYDNIYLGDMMDLIGHLGRYDLVFLGDVIEHVPKEDGVRLLTSCLEHANQAVIVSTPAKFVPQEAACGNPLEVHRSFWADNDFTAIGRCVTKTVENDILIAVLAQQNVPMPLVQSLPQRRHKSRAPHRLRFLRSPMRRVVSRLRQLI